MLNSRATTNPGHAGRSGRVVSFWTRQQPRLVTVRANRTFMVGGKSPTSPAGWASMVEVLRKDRLRFLSAQEVSFAQERGTPVIDVRPAEDFKNGRVPGAVNVPLYQSITGWTPWKVARRLGFALFGVLNGTEPNETFVADVAAIMAEAPSASGGRTSLASAGSGKISAILYCSLGGSLEATQHTAHGRQTRSLIAAHVLFAGGHNDVAIMRTGYDEWAVSGREVEVDAEDGEQA